MLGLNSLHIGHHLREPFAHAGQCRIVGCRAAALQALGQLGQEHLPNAPQVKGGQQVLHAGHSEHVHTVGAQVGQFARRFEGGHAVGQPAQVFNQHHA